MKLKALSLSVAAGMLATTTEGASLRGQSIHSDSRRALRVDNTRGIQFPEFRYVPWCMLGEKTQIQAEAMECKLVENE